MGRAPSDATQLRQLRSEFNALNRSYDKVLVESRGHKIRADRAELEVAKWQERFDLLLKQKGPKP